MANKKLQKEFENTGYASWINSDIYPDNKIYTKEYTEWLENSNTQMNDRIVELEERTMKLIDKYQIIAKLQADTGDKENRKTTRRFIVDLQGIKNGSI